MSRRELNPTTQKLKDKRLAEPILEVVSSEGEVDENQRGRPGAKEYLPGEIERYRNALNKMEKQWKDAVTSMNDNVLNKKIMELNEKLS